MIFFLYIRFDELQINHLDFLLDEENDPSIVLLFQDVKKNHYIKTYKLENKEKDLQLGPWSSQMIDANMDFLIPLTSQNSSN